MTAYSDNQHNHGHNCGCHSAYVHVANRTHPLAALFAFFIPGAGHLIKGDLVRAVFVFLVLCTTAVLFLPLAFFVWLWQLNDAYYGN